MDVLPEEATAKVIESFAATPNPRLKTFLESLTTHLHQVVREVNPTMAEWELLIDFLTRTGHKCDDQRQEFMLLSDVMGVTNLVEQLDSQRTSRGSTPTTVLGPFHMVSSPPRQLGDIILHASSGDPCLVEGLVTDIDGRPLPGATVDVWQADDQGFYDVQLQVNIGSGRGLFTTDEAGRFWFRTVTPAYYPVPTDGPVGELLAATNRHPNRPAHIHFIVESPGHHSVTTHAFVADSPYIDSDTVFAVKNSLVVEFAVVDDPEKAAALSFTNPYRHLRFDLRLAPEQSP